MPGEPTGEFQNDPSTQIETHNPATEQQDVIVPEEPDPYEVGLNALEAQHTAEQQIVEATKSQVEKKTKLLSSTEEMLVETEDRLGSLSYHTIDRVNDLENRPVSKLSKDQLLERKLTVLETRKERLSQEFAEKKAALEEAQSNQSLTAEKMAPLLAEQKAIESQIRAAETQKNEIIVSSRSEVFSAAGKIGSIQRKINQLISRRDTELEQADKEESAAQEKGYVYVNKRHNAPRSIAQRLENEIKDLEGKREEFRLALTTKQNEHHDTKEGKNPEIELIESLTKGYSENLTALREGRAQERRAELKRQVTEAALVAQETKMSTNLAEIPEQNTSIVLPSNLGEIIESGFNPTNKLAQYYENLSIEDMEMEDDQSSRVGGLLASIKSRFKETVKNFIPKINRQKAAGISAAFVALTGLLGSCGKQGQEPVNAPIVPNPGGSQIDKTPYLDSVFQPIEQKLQKLDGGSGIYLEKNWGEKAPGGGGGGGSTEVQKTTQAAETHTQEKEHAKVTVTQVKESSHENQPSIQHEQTEASKYLLAKPVSEWEKIILHFGYDKQTAKNVMDHLLTDSSQLRNDLITYEGNSKQGQEVLIDYTLPNGEKRVITNAPEAAMYMYLTTNETKGHSAYISGGYAHHGAEQIQPVHANPTSDIEQGNPAEPAAPDQIQSDKPSSPPTSSEKVQQETPAAPDFLPELNDQEKGERIDDFDFKPDNSSNQTTNETPSVTPEEGGTNE